MISCQTCQHEEYYGAIFCSECGSKLNYQKPTPPKTDVHPGRKPSSSQPHQPSSVHKAPSQSLSDSALSLKVIETGVLIPLEGDAELTLGRISGDQPILPDLDLTPYQAYESGVSRLHATIRIEENILTITDLGSANGTRVNGKKVLPHEPFVIKDGDILTLGKFKLQVLIRN